MILILNPKPKLLLLIALMIFLLRLIFFFLSHIDFLELIFSMTYLTKKMTCELTYETLNFMNIYLLKVNSVHLSSAKYMP